MREVLIIKIWFISFLCFQVQAQELSEIESQLIVAAEKGDTIALARLIGSGANVNTSTYEGYTPLMFASMNGQDTAVRLLVQSGAKPDMRDDVNGYTALIFAVLNGYINTTETLIRLGADIDMGDYNKITPLMYSIEVDSFFMADLLMYYGANIQLKDNSGRNALMLASRHGRLEIAVSLLESGINADEKDPEGNTALHYAAAEGETTLMELLIINGASIDQKNNQGYTPLAIAVISDDYKGAKLLIGYGADVNAKISKSTNLLVLSENSKNDSIKNLLLVNQAETIYRPNFNHFIFGTDFLYNTGDAQTGFLLGFFESRYNIATGIRYSFRPKAIRVLEKEEDNTYFQFWERRHFVSVYMSKAFFVQKFPSGFSTGAYAGASGTLTFGTYKGASRNPDTRFLFEPEVGLMFQYNHLVMRFGYEWLDLGLRGYNSQWFGISAFILFNLKNNRFTIQ